MNMNMVQVHTPNKTLGSKHRHLLVAGILMSSLLTAAVEAVATPAEELRRPSGRSPSRRRRPCGCYCCRPSRHR